MPGKDYHNIRLTNYSNVKNYEESSLDRTHEPRMSWHDIAIQVRGTPVKDLSRHFITYWNFTQMESNIIKKKGVINQGITPIDKAKIKKILTESILKEKTKSSGRTPRDERIREDRRLLTYLEKKERDFFLDDQEESKIFIDSPVVYKPPEHSSCDSLSVASDALDLETNRQSFLAKRFQKLIHLAISESIIFQKFLFK